MKDIILFVNSVPETSVTAIKSHNKTLEHPFRIMLLRDSKLTKQMSKDDIDIIEYCDFSSPQKIAAALLPYQNELKAITCRAESNIAQFRKVIPHVPYLRTPSTESLLWSTDKYEMRKRFRLFDPKHTPKFTLVDSNTKKERERIIEKVGFPLIIKPTNLAASALVSICYHEEELETTLRRAFRKMRTTYEKNQRAEQPRLMAEAYMEGDMYSVDAYVNTRGDIYFCPMVRVKTGQNIGHDDFYNYLRITPTALKKTSIEVAQERVEKGVHALGLRNVTVHAELMRVDDEWRLIEIGPRVGGYRHQLYELSCDIDHSLNDIFIRIPKKPVIPKRCKGFAAMLRYYPDAEGKIIQMNGIKKIKELSSFHSLDIKLKVGDRCYYSKNGGKGVFDVALYNNDRSKLLADIRRIEQSVKVVVGNGKKVAQKLPSKKKSK